MLAKFVAVAGFYALVVFQANAWPVGYPGAVPNPDVNPQPASSGISSLTAPNVPRANLAAAALLPAVAGAVTTYHYDNFRTGWDQTETSLTPANAGYIEQLHSISLDGQSDAQPLYMPNMNLGGLPIAAPCYSRTASARRFPWPRCRPTARTTTPPWV
jgi:hypothetical protein